MSAKVVTEYISVGGNRHSAASAWSENAGILAFGADQIVALWRPLSNDRTGVEVLLQGHNDKVSAVTFLEHNDIVEIISGSSNGELCVWSRTGPTETWNLTIKVEAHAGAVNTIATIENSNLIATGGADATIKIWLIEDGKLTQLAIIETKPRFIPLALVLGEFAAIASEIGMFLVAAGTRNDIQIFSLKDVLKSPAVELQATLTGHEGWIRSLALKKVEEGYLLASTSHDKYVRLWKFQPGNAKPRKFEPTQIRPSEPTLTAKVKTVGVNDAKYSITFEALLLGHEDWVYSADWQSAPGEKLLTASADGTLAIWEPDPSSGIWVSESRLGEISGQKGATTATGSTGGFWTGMWVEKKLGDKTETAVVSLGRTGSWRIWKWNLDTQYWNQTIGISGHVASANGLSWAPDGGYLLSTSSDQTTRLHAEWRRNEKRTWHEFSRPQIHGYDLNCVSHTNPHQFVSGADEKLLRVFNQPKEIANALLRLCNIEASKDVTLPETAAIPVLGLSNKALGEPDDIIEAGPRRGDDDYAAANRLAEVSMSDIEEPPTEDLLARHTLWPEHEKLYGHGYEISESTYGNGVLATACKASSLDHATIRLYDPSNDWREIKPPLAAHSLTVTRLVWSLSPDTYLLSVGRDRQWAVFKSDQANSKRLKLQQSNAKAHTRMIFDAAWSPVRGKCFFATAGRDKNVKIWARESLNSNLLGIDAKVEDVPPFELEHTLSRDTAVTAISFTANHDESYAILAVGEDDGSLSLHFYNIEKNLQLQKSVDLEKKDCSSKTINRLAWRAGEGTNSVAGKGQQLAVAGADGSVRILCIDVEEMCQNL